MKRLESAGTTALRILAFLSRREQGYHNVPHPPSPQMVIEIFSAIAWSTTINARQFEVGVRGWGDFGEGKERGGGRAQAQSRRGKVYSRIGLSSSSKMKLEKEVWSSSK